MSYDYCDDYDCEEQVEHDPHAGTKYCLCDSCFRRREDWDRQKSRAYARHQRYSRAKHWGETVPASGNGYDTLPCSSRQTRVEQWLRFQTPQFFRGQISERSLAASYTYARIDSLFIMAAKAIFGKKAPAWHDSTALGAVIEQYWLLVEARPR